MKNVYIKAISEALVEKAKVEASVSGLLRAIAERKRDHLEEMAKKMKPHESKGFVFAKASYEISNWGNSAFSVSADFILKDIKIPSNATAKEIELLKEYKNMIKDVNWRFPHLAEYTDRASSINGALSCLKNKIEVHIRTYWSYTFSDIQREDIFTRGFSFERRER